MDRRFCNVCGAPLEGGERFCTACGTPVDATGPMSPPTAAPSGMVPPPAAYGYPPPPAKKSKALPITLGILGGLAVIIILLVVLFAVGGNGNGDTNGAKSGDVTLADYQGTWMVNTVDDEPVDSPAMLNAWVEYGHLKLATSENEVTFELELQSDGSLLGTGYAQGEDPSPVKAQLLDGGNTLKLIADPDGSPSVALLTRYTGE